jgi:hypothetical protein
MADTIWPVTVVFITQVEQMTWVIKGSWVELVATPSVDSKTVTRHCFDSIIAKQRVPFGLCLSSDLGSGFISQLTEAFAKLSPLSRFIVYRIIINQYHEPNSVLKQFTTLYEHCVRISVNGQFTYKQSQWVYAACQLHLQISRHMKFYTADQCPYHGA